VDSAVQRYGVYGRREELKVLVTSSDPVAGTGGEGGGAHAADGTATEERYMERCMERKWWTKQAVQRVEERKSRNTARAVERAAKCS
jgi:hypothetical protein